MDSRITDEEFTRVDKNNTIMASRVSVVTGHTHIHSVPAGNIFKTFDFVTCPQCKALVMQFHIKYSGGNWR